MHDLVKQNHVWHISRGAISPHIRMLSLHLRFQLINLFGREARLGKVDGCTPCVRFATNASVYKICAESYCTHCSRQAKYFPLFGHISDTARIDIEVAKNISQCSTQKQNDLHNWQNCLGFFVTTMERNRIYGCKKRNWPHSFPP